MKERVLTPAIEDEIRRLDRADIMVGIPSYRSAATIGYVVRAAHAGLVQYFPELRPVLVNADADSPDGTGRVVVETEPPEYVEQILLVRPQNRLTRVTLSYPTVDGVSGKGAAVRTMLEIAAALRVQALVLVDADLRSIMPEWIELLAGPILKGGFDYVAPLYVRHRFDGTITNQIAYPLTRALYGYRIRQPIGGDFGLSGDLVRRLVAADDWTDDVSRFGIDIWLTTSALTGGFAISQARLGAKIHDPKDPAADLRPMFRQVVSTILRLTAAHADAWPPIEGSHDVPTYGFERHGEPPPIEVDADALAARFDTAAAEPGAAAEWRDLFGVDVAGAPLDDDRWAQVVYGAALAVGRGEAVERVVDALEPIHFGRLAAFIRAASDATDDESEALIERQALAFERRKPNFVAAWATLDGADAAAADGAVA